MSQSLHGHVLEIIPDNDRDRFICEQVKILNSQLGNATKIQDDFIHECIIKGCHGEIGDGFFHLIVSMPND